MLTTGSPNRNRLRRRGGFTLVEIALAMIIFLTMVLMFAAAFPLAVRGSLFANYYSEATMVAQHKLDQMRATGFSKIQNAANLSTLELCDSGAASVAPPYTVNFASIDTLPNDSTHDGLFPTGTTGTIKVVDYSTLSGLSNPPPAGQVDIVTITISWTQTGNVPSSYAISGLIIKMPHQ